MHRQGFVLLFALPVLSLAAANLEVRPLHQLAVDQNGTAVADLSFCNKADNPVGFTPVLSDFEHEFDGKRYSLGTTSAWTNAPATLAKGCTTVRLTISRIWEAGVSTATLRNGSDPIAVAGSGSETAGEAVITAVRLPAAVNVQVASSTPDSPEIHFVGNRALVGLKNADTCNYPMRWKLQTGDGLLDGGSVLLRASGTTYLRIPPDKPAADGQYPSANWLLSGTLKDEVRPARLILEPDFGVRVAQPPPAKELPVVLRFSRFTAAPQQICNVLCILVLLFLGGAASLAINSGIPNYKNALALSATLEEIEERIEGMSTCIESRWRVLLICHARALRHKLDMNSWWYPSFAPALAAASQTAAMLETWVKFAYSVAMVLHDAQEHLDILPPTVLREIEQHCQRGLAPIQSGFTNESEIAAMRGELELAQKRLDLVLSRSQDPVLEKAIKEREALLKPLLPTLITTYPEFAGILEVAKKHMDDALTVAGYVERDINSLKASLIQTYDERLQAVPLAAAQAASGSTSGSPALPPARARLLEQGKRLTTYIIPNTHESLRLAMLFGEEMQQDFYPGADSKMLTAVHADPPQIAIHSEPQRLSVDTPARLFLCFDQSLLNEAAAKREWTCEWTFGDGIQTETGWEVFHTFTSTDPVEIRVRIRDLDGQLLAEPKKSVPIAGDDRKWYALSKESHLELARLLIVLLLALLGLMAAAQEKARNLTFLDAVCAVVAVGFGAGAIKDMILRTDKGKGAA